jgi:hypothetical protein
MTHLQEQWQGIALTGNYTLGQWLEGNESAARFQGTTAEGQRCIVKLTRQAGSDDLAPLDLGHRARQLRHPNLVELLDFGRTEHEGAAFFYAIYEAPDDTLASALQREPLSSPDAHDVLAAVLDALRYLHAQGLVIGRLDAEHIVAVGDRIKLATDALRDAETSADYREDVRLLGELWQTALMAASPRSEELAAHAADPNSQARWTLAELHAALSPPAPIAVEADSAPDVSPIVFDEPVVVAAPPVIHEESVFPPPHHERPALPAPVFHFPRWILVGAGVFLLIIFALNRPRQADVATQPRVVPSPATSAPPPPPVAAPVAPLPAPVPHAQPAAAPKSIVAEAREIWRVIAFTYSTRGAAEKKVQQLNHDHPGLNATVFLPKGQRYYLVALGGRMTREDAMRLQHSARGKGLPHDLYIQNYSD